MLAKRFSLCMVVLTFFGLSICVSGQIGPVRGVVKLKQADGTLVPAADVVVEPIRIDITQGKAPETRTNKNGEFSFAGLSLTAKYVLAVSGPTISPTVSNTIRGGMEGITIGVAPGDGRRLTEAEVREVVKALESSPQTEETVAERKKAKEEYDKQLAKHEAEKKKVENINKVVNAALKEGNDAFNAKNYELAVSKYNEGIAVDPEFVGSAPLFYNNIGASLRLLAIDNYNNNVKVADPTEKAAGMARVKKLLADSSDSYLKSWNVLKNAQAADLKNEPNYQAHKMSALRGAVETLRMAVKTQQVDAATVEVSKVILPEFLAAESDAAKKTEASIITGDLYRIIEDRDNAVIAYKKVLESSPENVDALAYLGIVLVDLGWLKENDKALTQEGANYLQKFVSIAPDSHVLKTGAVEYLSILKSQDIVPVKATPTRKRP